MTEFIFETAISLALQTEASWKSKPQNKTMLKSSEVNPKDWGLKIS